MSLLNIGGGDDPAYRYKMPPVVGKKEGIGNGKKTVIVNADDVGKALKRPWQYLVKYCAVELGAVSTFDKEQGSGTVNGWHDTPMLQEKTNKFIKEWVLCPRCKLPETSMELGKKKDIIFDCKACGYHGGADMMHKLATFILNNPPDPHGGIMEKGKEGKKTKEDRKAEKAAKAKARAKAEESDDDDDDDAGAPAGDSWDKRGGGGGGKVGGRDTDDEEDDDEDWAVDVSDAAVKAREDKAQASFDKIEAAMGDASVDDAKNEKKSKKDKKKKDEADDDWGESPLEEQMAKIRTAMTPGLEKSAEGATDEAVKILGVVAKEHDLKPNDLFGFIFESFDENAVKQIGSHAKLLGKLYKAVPDKKKSQSFLLTCISTLVCKEGQRDTLLKKTPVILKKLYDIDLLEEPAIVAWFDKGSKKKDGKAVREAAAPFVNWLKEASEDEDESDDEE